MTLEDAFVYLSIFWLALSTHSIQATHNHKWILSSRYPVEQGDGQKLREPKRRAEQVIYLPGVTGTV